MQLKTIITGPENSGKSRLVSVMTGENYAPVKVDEPRAQHKYVTYENQTTKASNWIYEAPNPHQFVYSITSKSDVIFITLDATSFPDDVSLEEKLNPYLPKTPYPNVHIIVTHMEQGTNGNDKQKESLQNLTHQLNEKKSKLGIASVLYTDLQEQSEHGEKNAKYIANKYGLTSSFRNGLIYAYDEQNKTFSKTDTAANTVINLIIDKVAQNTFKEAIAEQEKAEAAEATKAAADAVKKQRHRNQLRLYLLPAIPLVAAIVISVLMGLQIITLPLSFIALPITLFAITLISAGMIYMAIRNENKSPSTIADDTTPSLQTNPVTKNTTTTQKPSGPVVSQTIKETETQTPPSPTVTDTTKSPGPENQ